MFNIDGKDLVTSGLFFVKSKRSLEGASLQFSIKFLKINLNTVPTHKSHIYVRLKQRVTILGNLTI